VERYLSPSQVTTIEASSSLSKTASGRIDLRASLTPCQPTKRSRKRVAYLEQGRLQPKKSVAFCASAVEACELLFRTTLPCVSGEGHTKLYLVSARWAVSAWYAAVESLMVCVLWFRGPGHGARDREEQTQGSNTRSSELVTRVPVPEPDGSNASPKAAKRCVKALRLAGLLARDAADV
jgi:hypothetical protein